MHTRWFSVLIYTSANSYSQVFGFTAFIQDTTIIYTLKTSSSTFAASVNLQYIRSDIFIIIVELYNNNNNNNNNIQISRAP